MLNLHQTVIPIIIQLLHQTLNNINKLHKMSKNGPLMKNINDFFKGFN